MLYLQVEYATVLQLQQTGIKIHQNLSWSLTLNSSKKKKKSREMVNSHKCSNCRELAAEAGPPGVLQPNLYQRKM